MKKIILGFGVLLISVVLVGCGGTTQQTTNEKANNTTGTGTVTKQEINDVQNSLQKIKAEILKVQMDKTLTKEQKAKKIEALQAQIQNQANTAKNN